MSPGALDQHCGRQVFQLCTNSQRSALPGVRLAASWSPVCGRIPASAASNVPDCKVSTLEFHFRRVRPCPARPYAVPGLGFALLGFGVQSSAMLIFARPVRSADLRLCCPDRRHPRLCRPGRGHPGRCRPGLCRLRRCCPWLCSPAPCPSGPCRPGSVVAGFGFPNVRLMAAAPSGIFVQCAPARPPPGAVASLQRQISLQLGAKFGGRSGCGCGRRSVLSAEACARCILPNSLGAVRVGRGETWARVGCFWLVGVAVLWLRV
jgi:hypothetical protein